MKTRFVSYEKDDDSIHSVMVSDIVELGDSPIDRKWTRARLMRQFGFMLNQMLDGSIVSITVERD